MKRPGSDEYLPYYAHYIGLVGSGDVVGILESQIRETLSLLRSIPDSRGTFRYAPGKWSINEVVGHLIDAERIFAVRALRFARADKSPLPGWEQDDYIAAANFDEYPLSDLTADYESVRKATCFLYRHMNEEATTRRGIANGAEVSVRALAYITAGHELHHRGVIKEKYQGAKG
jgi:uncharacterized damage-inducible protein DinB